MVGARCHFRVLLALALIVLGAASAVADPAEDMTLARSRMNASAEKVRRSDARLTDDQKAQRRDLLAEARGLHDDSKSMSPGDDARATSLAQEMDATRDELDAFLAAVSSPSATDAAAAGPPADGATMESSGPAATFEPIPEEPAKPATPGATVARYRDIARDVVAIRARLLRVENDRVRELIGKGDLIAKAIEMNPHEDHVAREAAMLDLTAVTDELHDMHLLGLSDRREGIPFLDARQTASGWTNVGIVQGPFAILRVRFLKPGSAYVTLRNASDAARPFAVSLAFTDVAGQPTGSAAFASQSDANLRVGEVREVLLGIAPSLERFWDLTTDFSVSVQ